MQSIVSQLPEFQKIGRIGPAFKCGVVSTAGNDAGRSAGLFTHAERSEGVADLQATIRNKADGTVLATQPLKATAKYQQRTTLGFTGKGKYSIKNAEGKFEPVADPSSYR